MDFLTLIKALNDSKAQAQAAAQAALAEAIEYANSLAYSDANLVVTEMDKNLSVGLLLNALRQHVWDNEADTSICEYGSVTLNNSAKFPFNDSQQTVALQNTQRNTKYIVIVDDVTAGNIGDIIVTDKQVNGFKIAYTGSAASATVKYTVIGGFIK